MKNILYLLNWLVERLGRQTRRRLFEGELHLLIKINTSVGIPISDVGSPDAGKYER